MLCNAYKRTQCTYRKEKGFAPMFLVRSSATCATAHCKTLHCAIRIRSHNSKRSPTSGRKYCMLQRQERHRVTDVMRYVRSHNYYYSPMLSRTHLKRGIGCRSVTVLRFNSRYSIHRLRDPSSFLPTLILLVLLQLLKILI